MKAVWFGLLLSRFLSNLTSIPFREGGRGTAILPRVGVLPRELGACKRPCLGGRAGTISPTSSNKSSPADGKKLI